LYAQCAGTTWCRAESDSKAAVAYWVGRGGIEGDGYAALLER